MWALEVFVTLEIVEATVVKVEAKAEATTEQKAKAIEEPLPTKLLL